MAVMAAEAHERWDVLKKVLGFFTREEVKTPLSFYFKFVAYYIGSVLIILYSPITDNLKLKIFEIDTGMFVFVCLVVTVFGWCRPKHLVYGEAGHRAERKMEFGTEKHTMTREEYDLLENVSNPKQLESGRD